MSRSIKFLILPILLLSGIIFSQSNYKINQITTEDGLINNTVSCVYQDSRGFIWIGSNAGLQRYDGINFINYREKSSNPNSLSNNYVNKIIEDSHGYIWVGTVGGGLNRLDPSTGIFKRYNIIFNDKNSFPHIVVKDIFIDKNNELWIASPFAFSKYSYEEDNFKNYFAGGPTYNPEMINYVINLREKGNIIAEAIRVRDNSKISKPFVIKKKKKVIVVSEGELPNGDIFDYGTITNLAGKIIWNMEWAKSKNAGGSDKNRICYDVIELEAGEYKLNYVTDNDHSYNRWNLTPPDYPDFWGIQVLNFSISEEEKIQRLIANKIMRNGLASSELNKIDEFSDGRLWIATSNGISIFDSRTGKFDNIIPSELNSEFKNNNSIEFIWENSPEKEVIALTSKGAFIFIDRETFRIKTAMLNLKFPYMWQSAIEFEKGKLWLFSENNGIFRFDIKTRELLPLKLGKEIYFDFEMNALVSLLKDKEGALWIPTAHEGIKIVRKNNPEFHSLFSKTIDKNLSGLGPVSSILTQSNGNLWLGTNGRGLYFFNKSNSSLTNFSFTEKDQLNNASNHINKIFYGSKGDLWLGSGDGLIQFNPRDNSYKRIENKYKDNQNTAVYSIFEDNDESLWYGIGDILVKYNKASGIEEHYKVEPPYTFVIPYPSITGIIPYGNDKLWVLTWWGLFSFDKNLKRWTYYEDMNEKFPISNQYWTITEDNDGIIWLGSLIEGLKYYNPKTKKFGKYTIEDGLPSNKINSIICLNNGKFWLGTEKGLTLFDKKDKRFINFTKEDGLPSNNYFRNSFTISDKKEIFLGSNNGIIFFNPYKIVVDENLSEVRLSEIKIFNKRNDSGKLYTYTNKIEIDYEQNVFTIVYSMLNFKNPFENRYKYKMEGFDKNWIDAGNKNEVTYTNLDPGEYTFKVIGYNNGEWNKKPLELSLIINPPWYRTWWAYILYGLIFVSLYLSARRFELNKISLKNDLRIQKLEADKLKETDRVKSNFFANISHEFRTPLTLILEPVEKLISKTADFRTKQTLEMVQRNSKQLLQLINQLLDLSKLESGSMKLSIIRKDFVPFFKGTAASFDSLAMVREIDYNVYSDVDSLIISFDPDKIQKIINNLISNALKFTPKGGKVNCELISDIENIKIKISDTGIGIEEENKERIFDRFYQVDSSKTREHEGSGIGLALTKELVEIHHGKIELTSSPEFKTIFIVSIPIDDSLYIDSEIGDGKISENEFVVLNIDNDSKIIANKIDYENKPVVLLVEDNADMRKFIIEVLSPRFNIIESVNGEEGIKEAIEKIPDIIISDVMMPMKDGYQLCKEIKSEPITSHIPVILLTAKAAIENKIEGLEIGADDYLVKPFNSNELIARITNLIGLREKLQKKLLSEINDKKFIHISDYKGLTKHDKELITRIIDKLEENYSDPDYDVEKLGGDLGYSSSTLRRKTSALLNKSPNEFIRYFRLQKALKLITEEGKNVSETAFESGFNSISYFSKCFTEEFGKNPSEFIK